MVHRSFSELGGLDVVVNNVAYQEPVQDFAGLTSEQWRRTFATTIDSFFHVTRAAVEHLPSGGAVINTGSINGLRGNKTLIDYSATKGAVIALTYSLAQALLERLGPDVLLLLRRVARLSTTVHRVAPQHGGYGPGMGPIELLLVRHGESAGNVARERAEAAGAEVIDIDQRDADVPLSPLGGEQARAFGRWLAELPPQRRPQSLWCSPYVRARQTAELALDEANLPLPERVDERLRDRELGVLDLLTARGRRERFPEEEQRRRWLGKFYHRPPGGESWADVILRLRSWLTDLERTEHGRRVLVVGHDAVIVMTRYICEGMSEAQVLEIARTSTVVNTSVTRLLRSEGSGPWQLDRFNAQDHLRAHGSTPTEHPAERDGVAG